MSALRTLRQLTATSSRLAVRRAPLARLALPAVCAPATRAFSASACALKAGSSDVLLSQKLAEELDYERQAAEETAEDVPDFLAAFQEQGVWTIQDTEGNDEVFLTRKFGDENIRLMFSIADLQSQEEYEEEEGEEEPEEEELPGNDMRVSMSITKATAPGALNVDMYCSDGAFTPGNVAFYGSAKLGQELSIESDFSRRTLYAGPQFETLDVALQEGFERFLEERTITKELAQFIPEYAQYKEQKEYVKWLENVKNFVDV
ncbi:mitochondrial glycoprotein [Mycena sp. CBHHK59/15]|nr:mitochondrial glycoprotein [Mycena sp. CBHHK59/15]